MAKKKRRVGDTKNLQYIAVGQSPPTRRQPVCSMVAPRSGATANPTARDASSASNPPPPLQHTTAHASKRTGFSNGSRGEDDDDEDAARRPSTAPAGACRAVTERAREKANMSDAVAATVSLTSGKEARRGEEGEKKKSAQWGSSAGVARDDQAGRRGRARNRSGAVGADARGTGGT